MSKIVSHYPTVKSGTDLMFIVPCVIVIVEE